MPTALQAQATVPGTPGIEPTRIRFGVVEYSLTLVRGDEEQLLGTIRDELIPVRASDPVLRRVITVTRPGGMLIDSTITDLETLAPLWHKSVQPTRAIEFEINGTQVQGVVLPVGGKVVPIDTTLAELAFDSSNWDLVVRSLPLADGDAALLSVYDVDERLHRYIVRVVERQVRGRTDVIHVTLEMGRGRIAHAWFDEETRVLLRVETQVAPDAVVRQVLKRQ